MTQVRAIDFDTPRTLAVQTLELKPFGDADLAVEVSASGNPQCLKTSIEWQA